MSERNRIEIEYELNFLKGLPIEFKGVTLYPVMCNNIFKLYECVNSLLYDPLRYNIELNVGTLPRLYFLTDVLNHLDDKEYLIRNQFLVAIFRQLNDILDLVLKEQEYKFINIDGKWALVVYKQSETGKEEIVIRARDFEEMRKIILHQNKINYDDTFIHEDIRQWIAEQEKDDDVITLENYLYLFMIEMKILDIEAFEKLTVRRFAGMISKILARENYNIQMTAAMSGLVTFKNEVKHWLVDDNTNNSILTKYFKEIN